MTNKPTRVTFRERMDTMVATLRNDIAGGKLSAGAFLPSEVELGNRFQLSKNSVRKALDILVSENLIEKVPCVGTRVRSRIEQHAVTIRLGCYISAMEQTNLNEILADFQAAYPHIRVQTVFLPFVQYEQSLMNYLHNDMLDVFTINQNDFYYVGEQNNMDWLEPLDPPDGLYPFLHKSFTCENRLYAAPFVFSPLVLCYNKNHFTENNLREPDSSWSWFDLKDAASSLANRNRFGLYFYLMSLNRWPIFLLQSGEKLRAGKNGDLRIAGTKLANGLSLCRDLIYSDCFLPPFVAEGSDDAEQLFLQEKVSMIITTYFSMNYLKDAKFAFDISPLPYFEQPASLLSTMGLGINRKSNNKKAAQTLVHYLLGHSAQLSIRQNSFSIPSLIEAAEWKGQGSVPHPSRYHMYREIIPTFKQHMDLNISPSELELIHNELKLFWSRLEHEDEACRRLELLLSAVPT